MPDTAPPTEQERQESYAAASSLLRAGDPFAIGYALECLGHTRRLRLLKATSEHYAKFPRRL